MKYKVINLASIKKKNYKNFFSKKTQKITNFSLPATVKNWIKLQSCYFNNERGFPVR